MHSDQTAWLVDIEQWAAERCAKHDAAHDLAHVRRVVANTLNILNGEPDADRFTTLAAAWLHDIVQLPKGTGEPGESARRSASEASQFLMSIGVDAATVERIAGAIASHSFSGGLRPDSLEAAIVQDADRLDALGAIGIARLWATAAVLGSKLHHPDDPAGEGRELNDRQYGLDHIPVKLLKLPGLMNTATGKRLATARAAYVSEHRDRFLAELRGEV